MSRSVAGNAARSFRPRSYSQATAETPLLCTTAFRVSYIAAPASDAPSSQPCFDGRHEQSPTEHRECGYEPGPSNVPVDDDGGEEKGNILRRLPSMNVLEATSSSRRQLRRPCLERDRGPHLGPSGAWGRGHPVLCFTAGTRKRRQGQRRIRHLRGAVRVTGTGVNVDPLSIWF